MKPDKVDYVRYRLSRAEATFHEARLLLENDSLYGAVNRLYYACFYGVCALLLTEGLYSSKHTGIRSLFARHWIKTKRLPTEVGRFYYRLFEIGQQGDYERVTFNRDDVESWFQEAQAFIVEISKQIEEQVRKPQGTRGGGNPG